MMLVSPLAELEESDQRIVRQLLRGFMDFPNCHINMVLISRTKPDQFTYYIGRDSDQDASPIPQPFYSSTNLTTPLMGCGFIEKTHTEGQFRFTAKAMDWYREATEPTNQQIQHQLGTYLIQEFHKGIDPLNLVAINLDQLASTFGISKERLLSNAQLLQIIGFIEADLGFGEALEDGYMRLTDHKGLAWANAGAGPISPDGSPVINVTVNVTLRQILKQAEQSGLSEEEKERFTELMTQLASEKKKNGSVIETVKNLLDIAKNTKELWPSIARFAMDHADDVGQAIHHIPHP